MNFIPPNNQFKRTRIRGEFDREKSEHQAFAATFANKDRQRAKEEFKNEFDYDLT